MVVVVILFSEGLALFKSTTPSVTTVTVAVFITAGPITSDGHGPSLSDEVILSSRFYPVTAENRYFRLKKDFKLWRRTRLASGRGMSIAELLLLL
jgi:hypothetical protein